ncbi:MAG: 4-(cytidine 5'-diphospho)-2-C-methyl-D-erythritol kinase, partial [Oscillospiraceae bacterium]|nr:4-(cytidine 5'-diphospho)-2-C-methyl-D-erythritol kinase [Oscillospiraceae bacterium]
MKSISVKAPAKINLFLDIVGRLPTGYHEIESVMQTIDLFDYVKISEDEEISVFCSDSALDGDSNIAFKAAKLFFEKTGIDSGVKIEIDKRIPKQAGMAGGSADAAAVLFGMNKIFGFPLSEDELCDLGAKCGADVPFSITGGTKLSEGIGEKLSSVPEIPDCWIVTVKPDISMSTPESYKYYDEHGLFALEHPGKSGIIGALEENDIYPLSKKLYNVLEHTVEDPIIKEIKDAMLSLGALGS